MIQRSDGKSIKCPIQYKVLKVSSSPEIYNVYIEDQWLRIEGKNFAIPSYVVLTNPNSEQKIKAYCNSTNSIIISLPTLEFSSKIYVHTPYGSSNCYDLDYN